MPLDMLFWVFALLDGEFGNDVFHLAYVLFEYRYFAGVAFFESSKADTVVKMFTLFETFYFFQNEFFLALFVQGSIVFMTVSLFVLFIFGFLELLGFVFLAAAASLETSSKFRVHPKFFGDGEQGDFITAYLLARQRH